jgi:hypothetical protein
LAECVPQRKKNPRSFSNFCHRPLRPQHVTPVKRLETARRLGINIFGHFHRLSGKANKFRNTEVARFFQELENVE